MRTGTKLILFLTVAVGIVMTLGGYYILRQREAILETAMRNELRAHAATLKIALEDAYRSGRTGDVQRLINRLSDLKSPSPRFADADGNDQRNQTLIRINLCRLTGCYYLLSL